MEEREERTTGKVDQREEQPIDDETDDDGESEMEVEVKTGFNARRHRNHEYLPISPPYLNPRKRKLWNRVRTISHLCRSRREVEIRLPDSLKNRYLEDSFFAPIFRNPSNFKHYSLESGLLFLKDDGRKLLCVPDIKLGERRIREIFITHAHSILAHLGSKKTLDIS